MYKVFSLALVALTLVGVTACGSSDSSSGSSGSTTQGTSSASTGGNAYAGGSSSASSGSSKAAAGGGVVEMDDNYFKPAVIKGKPGETVKVQLKNEGKVEHNFKVDGQKADADVKPGTTASVEVKIPMSGSVQFYCEYHKSLGMVGKVAAG